MRILGNFKSRGGLWLFFSSGRVGETHTHYTLFLLQVTTAGTALSSGLSVHLPY